MINRKHLPICPGGPPKKPAEAAKAAASYGFLAKPGGYADGGSSCGRPKDAAAAELVNMCPGVLSRSELGFVRPLILPGASEVTGLGGFGPKPGPEPAFSGFFAL